MVSIFNNRIYKTIKLAGSWYNKKLFTKHEELYMYNIELGLKVLDYISENESSEVLKSVTNQLNRIKFSDKVSYNDMFEDKLKELTSLASNEFNKHGIEELRVLTISDLMTLNKKKVV